MKGRKTLGRGQATQVYVGRDGEEKRKSKKKKRKEEERKKKEE